MIYENGTSQPLGTDVFLYLLYIRLDPASNDAVKVPLVLLTDILSAMADQSSALFESCTESPRMLYSVKRHRHQPDDIDTKRVEPVQLSHSSQERTFWREGSHVHLVDHTVLVANRHRAVHLQTLGTPATG